MISIPKAIIDSFVKEIFNCEIKSIIAQRTII